MNSALKPGVPTSPVPQQLNKPLLQQNTQATYGQPMSHLPQNLVNLPHSTPTPANAHSNNIHPTNHYPVSSSNVSQQFTTGSVPPPSNHPVANVNQLTPTKNIKEYNSNANNVAHSYKLPVPTVPDPPEPPANILSEEPLTAEPPQSNGTSEANASLEQELPQSHQTEPSIKDKPPPRPQTDVPETPTISNDKLSETIKPIITPEKPADIHNEATTVEQTTSTTDIAEATTPEAAEPSKSADLPETTVTDIPATPVISESASTSITSTETSVQPPVATTATISSDQPPQIEKSIPSTQPTEASESTVTKQDLPSTPSPPINKTKEQTVPKPTTQSVPPQRSPARKNKLPVTEPVEQVKPAKAEVKTPNQKTSGLVAKSKRNRVRTQPYQSPLPEVEMISKISAIASTSKTKSLDDKLIVFYKNEFLAVRNPDGGFYLCQTLHNIHKSTRKLRILWLSQDKTDSDIYTPDFYDHTDFDCILTNINLVRMGKGKFKLPDKERIRTDSILKRALAVEKGDATPPCPTEEHPDGLDLSLYKEESQLKKRKTRKRKASPLKSPKAADLNKPPVPEKIRKLEPRVKPPPITKALVIKKALAVKAKETNAVNVNRQPARTRSVDTEGSTTPKTSPVVDQKKPKVIAKVVKKPVLPTTPPQASSSTVKTTSPPRKQSVKTADAVVPFLRKELPILKKEVPAKKEYLVLKKESVLKKEIPLKKETPPKKTNDVSKKVIPTTIRKEMPVLKKEAPIIKKDVTVQKQVVLTRKSTRGKK